MKRIQTNKKKPRKTAQQKAATRQTIVWVVLSLLVVVGFGWFVAATQYMSPKIVEVTIPQLPSTTTTAQAPELAETEPEQVDISLLPKYGEVEKTQTQRQADEHFIEGILNAASSTQDAADQAVSRGWVYFYDGNTEMAMRRFNQAWLLEPETAEVLWGMAVVEGSRGNFDSSLELFGEALSYDDTNPRIYCDLGNTFLSIASTNNEVQEDMLLLAQEQYAVADTLGHTEASCYANYAAVALLLGDKESAEKYESIAQKLNTTNTEEVIQ